jgi:hypothetical protein
MTASTAAFAALIDDETTSLPFKRTAGSPGDLAELRTRPWWAIDQAGRELLAKGIPVVRRRAAVQAQGGRV